MISFSKNIFWKKLSKISIWVFIIAAFLTISVLSYFTQKEIIFLDPLPTWEVDNPVSKVFVMDKIPPTAGSLAAGDSTVPNEYLVDTAIDTLFLLMGAQNIHFYKTSSNPSGIVGSNDIVILKGSFQWDFRNTTSTDRIKGVIWRILQHPDGFTGEILVGDNTQWTATGEDDNNSEDIEQCITDVINTFHSKGYPVYLFEWKDIMQLVVTEYSDGDYDDGYPYDPASKISYPKFQSPSGNYYISTKYGIWDSNSQTYDHNRLCIVDFAVLKAHGMTGATLAIKNWIGVLTVAHQNERYGGGDAMHYDYMFSEYALPSKVMQVVYPKLTIIDAAWANPESNYGSDAVQLNMLLGSTDPFAASWYAAKYMLTPIAYDPESTNPDLIAGYRSYGKCLNNWINCMHDSGFAVTKDSSEISVYDRSVLSLPSYFPLTVSINDGWNIVSVPGINPDGMAVNTWWSNLTGSVFSFNGVQYVSETESTPGEGYWMNNTIAETYSYPAIQIVPHNPIPVTIGWNIIGGYETNPTIVSLKASNQHIMGSVFGYNGVQYVDADNLVPGYGYWVNVTTADPIVIPDVLSKGSAEVAEGFKEDLPSSKEGWGKIVLTDAAGISTTLYSVKGKVNLDEYSMPPLPPSGAFDIRYSSGRKAEDINSSVQTIDMTGITYPLTVRVNGMDIMLQDVTGKLINQNLKDGEEIVIGDSTIEKLMVTGELLPAVYALEQNYPNPFNPITKIQFRISDFGFVSLKVYDVLGNEVETLVNEKLSSGEYEVVFNTSSHYSKVRDLTSGIYFYQLRAGSFIETKKMVLLK